jgi:ABC-type uncharacterized transport system auxiliary subunit
MTRLVTTLLLLVPLVTACAGKVPETRFYQLATASDDTPSPRNPQGVMLAIEPLETDPAYDDERIVYRVTPFRLDYYNYHRWSSAPGTLIADYLERAFERSGRFRAVTRDVAASTVTLSGRVVAIEEVDVSKTQWIGRVVVELRLTDSTTGDVLWTEQFEEREPLPYQSPEGLAQGLSVALRRISDRALPIVSSLAIQVATASPPAKATTAPRSVRSRP